MHFPRIVESFPHVYLVVPKEVQRRSGRTSFGMNCVHELPSAKDHPRNGTSMIHDLIIWAVSRNSHGERTSHEERTFGG
jgi:hypothetical protein